MDLTQNPVCIAKVALKADYQKVGALVGHCPTAKLRAPGARACCIFRSAYNQLVRRQLMKQKYLVPTLVHCEKVAHNADL